MVGCAVRWQAELRVDWLGKDVAAWAKRWLAGQRDDLLGEEVVG